MVYGNSGIGASPNEKDAPCIYPDIKGPIILDYQAIETCRCGIVNARPSRDIDGSGPACNRHPVAVADRSCIVAGGLRQGGLPWAGSADSVAVIAPPATCTVIMSSAFKHSQNVPSEPY